MLFTHKMAPLGPFPLLPPSSSSRACPAASAPPPGRRAEAPPSPPAGARRAAMAPWSSPRPDPRPPRRKTPPRPGRPPWTRPGHDLARLGPRRRLAKHAGDLAGVSSPGQARDIIDILANNLYDNLRLQSLKRTRSLILRESDSTGSLLESDFGESPAQKNWPQVHRPDIVKCESFLAPPGDDENSSFRDFRVMCLVWCTGRTTKLVLLVFSSCTGQWLLDPVTFDVFPGSAALSRCYSHGCFCWQSYLTASLLVLDARRMEFSVVDLPHPPGPFWGMAVVEAGEGRLGMLTVSEPEPDAYQLLYEEQCKDGNGANQWQSKSVISLPANYYRYSITGVAGGYLLLHASPDDTQAVYYFSLNLQTFKIERFCQSEFFVSGTLYAGLPLYLSPPTI